MNDIKLGTPLVSRSNISSSISAGTWTILWLTICLPPLILVALDHSVAALVRFYPDDAFYYLQVAWNILQQGRCSFDGINSTSGFHPLQMLLAIFTFLFADKESALLFLFIFNAIAIATTLTLLIRKLSYNNIAIVAAMLLTLPVFTLYIWTSSGMESALLLICWAAFASSWLQGSLERWAVGPSFRLGICAGLVMLARLDMAIPLTLFGAAFLLRALANRALTALAAAVGGTILTVLPYFLWMLNIQGNIFPVSAIAKQGRPRWPMADIWRALSGDNIAGAAIVILPAVICLSTLIVAVRRRNVAANFILLTASSGLLYTTYLLFIAHEPFRWYLAYPIFASMTCIIWLSGVYADSMPVKFSPQRVLALAMLIGAVDYAALAAFSRKDTTSYGLYRMTHKLAELVPKSSRLATHDAGVVGYFSDFSVINLDGLINSLDNWRSYLAERNYATYLQKEKVEYLLVRDTLKQESFMREITTAVFDAQHADYFLEAGAFGNETLYKLDTAPH